MSSPFVSIPHANKPKPRLFNTMFVTKVASKMKNALSSHGNSWINIRIRFEAQSIDSVFQVA